MRVGVLLVVGLGILGVAGACSGPGATNDACTQLGNVCVPTANCRGETLTQDPCSASPSGFVCCTPSEVVGDAGID
jgi:hypothetical protein